MPFNPLPPNNRPKKSRGSNCHTAALEAPCDMDFTLAPLAPISPCSQGALVPRPYPPSFTLVQCPLECLPSQVSLPFSSSIDPNGKARHSPHHWTNSFPPCQRVQGRVDRVNEKSAIEAVSDLSTLDPNNRYNSQASSTASPYTQQNLPVEKNNPRESNQSCSSRYGSPSSLHYGEFPTLANLGTRYPGESQRRISPAFRLSRGFAVNDATSIFGDVVADTPGALGIHHCKHFTMFLQKIW
ncbi:hypothetical protein EDD16DRAFT_1768528 [Pisolithus croceorrhizus]|nr:hypothetical protein EDD16DRAFT_1768528 [Pisolithus croceorrhizus]